MAIERHPNGAWYVDPDDGTIIHLFDISTTMPLSATTFFDRTAGTRCPEPAIYFIQSTSPRDIGTMEAVVYDDVTCGINTRKRPTKKLTMSVALPSDFAFNSGRLVQYNDKLSLFLEEFTPSRVLLPTSLVGGNTDNSVRTFITRYDFINKELLGLSNGTASQTFTVSTILLPTLGTSIVKVNGQVWTKVATLTTASSTAKVFTYDATTGLVTFGDDVHGAIPADGAEIRLCITVKNGGGKWTYGGIIVNQKTESNIAILGAVQDRVLYAKAKIALADIGKFTGSLTTLNGDVTDNYVNINPPFYNVPILVSRQTLYHANFGGTLAGSGGTVVLLNCTSGSLVNYPSFSVPVSGSPVGAVGTITVSENDISESVILTGFLSVAITDQIADTTGCVAGPPISLDVLQFDLNGIIVSPMRETRVIQVGDVFGTFSSPVVSGAYNAGTSVVVVSPGGDVTFQKTGSSSLALVKVVTESHLLPFYQALADDLGVSILDFQCEYTFTPGDVVTHVSGAGCI